MAGTSKPKSQQRKTPQGKGRPAPQRNAERAAARKQVAAVILFCVALFFLLLKVFKAQP